MSRVYLVTVIDADGRRMSVEGHGNTKNSARSSGIGAAERAGGVPPFRVVAVDFMARR